MGLAGNCGRGHVADQALDRGGTADGIRPGATELLWGLPDASTEMVEGYPDRLADRMKA